MRIPSWTSLLLPLSLLPLSAAASQILKTTSFSPCNGNNLTSTVTVNKVQIFYDNSNKTVIFDVSGTSTKSQNVSAILNVKAYGKEIYSRTFNPCEADTFVEQLCPIPNGTFSAQGQQQIPKQYADMVPALAFQVPDIAARATLELKSLDSGKDVACIQSQVSNGKTADVPAVSYVAAAVAACALVAGLVSTVAAVASGGSVGGVGSVSPSFANILNWFQGMAMNGMFSVNYPPVYRSFSKNFGFSTGAIAWDALQTQIDNFRSKTGGNLTGDSVEALRNATLVFPDGSSEETAKALGNAKRAWDSFGQQLLVQVARRDTLDTSKPQLTVSGISAYVEQLSVPRSNIFMTALLIIAVIILAIVVSLLLVKLVLEVWALFGSFPKSLAGFRKHYWGSIARSITSLILLLYGVWVLYCIFQFTQGDSTVAKALAAVTLVLFTAVLAFFSWKIWIVARRMKDEDGDVRALYEDKAVWVKYSLFYESYRQEYWWIFVPTIFYMFAKGCALAAADGHGMVQTITQLVIEALMLILLLWSRPFERKSGNVINIVIQTVRVLSVVCILVFVEEFGIAQTTQTVMGVVLIAVQSALTGILAILMAWNAIIACFRENPHRKRRKELEQMRESEFLTPLGLQTDPVPFLPTHHLHEAKSSVTSTLQSRDFQNVYSSAEKGQFNSHVGTPVGAPLYHSRTSSAAQSNSQQSLVNNAAPMGFRQPTLPNLGSYPSRQPAAGTYQYARGQAHNMF